MFVSLISLLSLLNSPIGPVDAAIACQLVPGTLAAAGAEPLECGLIRDRIDAAVDARTRIGVLQTQRNMKAAEHRRLVERLVRNPFDPDAEARLDLVREEIQILDASIRAELQQLRATAVAHLPAEVQSRLERVLEPAPHHAPLSWRTKSHPDLDWRLLIQAKMEVLRAERDGRRPDERAAQLVLNIESDPEVRDARTRSTRDLDPIRIALRF